MKVIQSRNNKTNVKSRLRSETHYMPASQSAISHTASQPTSQPAQPSQQPASSHPASQASQPASQQPTSQEDPASSQLANTPTIQQADSHPASSQQGGQRHGQSLKITSCSAMAL